ncbi:MAG TPA: hypothetical protein DDY91_17100 [Planctomycetaceae bacterium]|jgi:membrane protease YdiL (CAAX protease family)|nr:hypothetical protein [Planctomycetaceae bacterium]
MPVNRPVIRGWSRATVVENVIMIPPDKQGEALRIVPQVGWSGLWFASLFPTVLTWIYFVAMAGQSAGWQQFGFALGKAVQFLWPVVWCWSRDRQALSVRSAGTTGVALGTALGLAITGAMLLFYWIVSSQGLFLQAEAAIRAKVSGLGISTPSKMLAVSVFYSVAHSFLEEYYFRWFLHARLERRLGFWPAAVWSGLAFMAHHIVVLGTYLGFASWLTWFLSLSIAIGGVLWSWLYRRTGNLLAPWVSHALVDAGIFLIGYHLVFPRS